LLLTTVHSVVHKNIGARASILKRESMDSLCV
jgi:hypothetical protein